MKFFVYFCILFLSLIASIRPFGIGTDFETYKINYSTGEFVTEPLYNFLCVIFRDIFPFEFFLFLLVFISLVFVFISIEANVRSSKRVLVLMFIYFLSFYPIFFLGHLRSGLASSILLFCISQKATDKKIFIYGLFAGLIHFGALMFCFFPAFKSIVLYLLNSKHKLFNLFFLLLTAFILSVSFQNINLLLALLPSNVVEDKWRLFSAFQGTLEDDFETRKLTIFNSPRYIYWIVLIVIMIITLVKNDLFSKKDSNFPLILFVVFGGIIFILFSSVAMLAFKVSYIYLPMNILIFNYFTLKHKYSLAVIVFLMLSYDFVSYSIPRFL
jgi:hypothetical protein